MYVRNQKYARLMRLFIGKLEGWISRGKKAYSVGYIYQKIDKPRNFLSNNECGYGRTSMEMYCRKHSEKAGVFLQHRQ